MSQSSRVTFRHVEWGELANFLMSQVVVAKDDIDHDVRKMHYGLYAMGCVEGIFVDEVLVGFARWGREDKHLYNLYVAPTARGLGVGSLFLNARPLCSLHVVPENHRAIAIYERAGFVMTDQILPRRRRMVRQLAQAA